MADVQLNSVKKTYDKTEVVHGVDLDIKSESLWYLLDLRGVGNQPCSE